jgi:hypothetical protein
MRSQRCGCAMRGLRPVGPQDKRVQSAWCTGTKNRDSLMLVGMRVSGDGS